MRYANVGKKHSDVVVQGNIQIWLSWQNIIVVVNKHAEAFVVGKIYANLIMERYEARNYNCLWQATYKYINSVEKDVQLGKVVIGNSHTNVTAIGKILANVIALVDMHSNIIVVGKTYANIIIVGKKYANVILYASEL